MIRKNFASFVAAAVALASCSAHVPEAARRRVEPSPSTHVASPPPTAPTAPRTSDVAAERRKPPITATMLCGHEIRNDIMAALGLHGQPVTRTTWADDLYTCTYMLPMGSLKLSVKDSGSPAAAQAYFDALHASLKDAKKLTGMEGLGQPGYETPDGVVVLLKDGGTLRVDATKLPDRLGPHKLRAADFAYEIATEILGCWNEK